MKCFYTISLPGLSMYVLLCTRGAYPTGVPSKTEHFTSKSRLTRFNFDRHCQCHSPYKDIKCVLSVITPKSTAGQDSVSSPGSLIISRPTTTLLPPGLITQCYAFWQGSTRSRAKVEHLEDADICKGWLGLVLQLEHDQWDMARCQSKQQSEMCSVNSQGLGYRKQVRVGVQ